MFEVAEMGQILSKSAYEAQLPGLRVALINAQYDLRQADFPVILVLTGNDRAGCNALLHTLHDVMDGRYMRTNALGAPSPEELEHPRFWRYWRTLPRRGQIGVYLGAWPLNAISDRVRKTIKGRALERRIEHIRAFEDALIADGALVLKFWLHLPKKALKKRLIEAKNNPEKAWQIGPADWRIYQAYDDAMPVAERVVRDTHTGDAPWHLVESTDPRHRDLTAATIILDALTARLDADSGRPGARPEPADSAHPDLPTILDTVDLSQALPRSDYRKRLASGQHRLSRLGRKAHARGVSTVLVFEGWDAAGKGGVIRRLTAAMDPEHYGVIPIAAPSPEERAHHYLWRFWRRLPQAGHMTLFDRSWYGRVLVERVEGFAREAEWGRAFGEINDFEEQLTESGVILLKFWLHIDADEQLKRFRKREATPYKKHKITEEDYRNRDQWAAYEQAVHEMVARTSTTDAPWHLIASKDKRWARIQVLDTVCKRLKQAL